MNTIVKRVADNRPVTCAPENIADGGHVRLGMGHITNQCVQGVNDLRGQEPRKRPISRAQLLARREMARTQAIGSGRKPGKSAEPRR
jgi:hypothetical protein